MRGSIALTTLLMLGLWNVLAAPAADAQAQGRTLKRSVVEGPSTRGERTVLSEVVDETVRRDASTSQRTRSEFIADQDGRQRLASVMEEQRVARPDGGHQISRAFMDLDVDGRSATTRREHEQMTARGNGVFVTDIEVSQPSINGGGFVSTARVQQRERRVGDQVVERDATTTINPTGTGTWNVLEQRVLTRTVAEGRAEGVETIYRLDSSGNLVQSERIVSRDWTERGQEFHTDEVYRQDINNGGSLARQPLQLVEVVRTTLSGGASETTRTVSQRMGDRLQVIERVVERSRPDGRGGFEIEQNIQRSIVSDRLETVTTGRRLETQ